jgi:hypothetical protein
VSVEDNVVTFVADKALYLLGDYTLTISDSVADLAGNTLGEETSVAFKVRDGRWSEPTYPFGETVPRLVSAFQRNALGDVVVELEARPALERVYGAVYTASENRWTSATELRAMAAAQYYAYRVAIDDARNAVATWGGYNAAGYGWSRFTDLEGWASAGPLTNFALVTINSENQATAVYSDLSSNYVDKTMNLSDATKASSASLPTAYSSALTMNLTTSLDRPALFATLSTMGSQELTVSWKDGPTWSSPALVATAPEFGSYNVDADDEGNILVVWEDGGEVWSRIYQRNRDEWTRAAFIGGGIEHGIIGACDLTAGNAIVTFNSFDPSPGAWAAIYIAGVGWIEDSLTSIDGTWTGASVGVAISKRGDALLTWHTEAKFRRYIHGNGWQPAVSQERSIDAFSRWNAMAPDGSVLVMSNAPVRNGNYVPWVARFE